MEKNSIRSNQANAKSQNSGNKNLDVSNKQWPRGSRRRESSNLSNSKSEPIRINKSTQGSKNRFNNYNDRRQREKSTGHQEYNSSLETQSTSSTGLENDYYMPKAEMNSVFLPGSKKQNLNHLLNFSYVPRDREPPNLVKTGNCRNYNRKLKFNKEQFLQANCQFVVRAGEEYENCNLSPDEMVDWNKIEQIITLSMEAPQCPICLFSPVAGKITKCGHVYCWACILHYLALSDKNWRKCPICFESIHINDLKSALSKPYRIFNIGDIVSLQLMRREKGRLNIAKANSKSSKFKIPNLSDTTDDVLHSKLLIANDDELLDILCKEKQELERQIEIDGPDCPESVFIHQAMELLNIRQNNIVCSKSNEVLIRKSKDLEETNLDKLSLESNDNIIESDNNNVDASQYFYFYQSIDGQNLYLHSVNIRMIQSMYGSLEHSLPIISGKILQKDSCSMSEELRPKFKYLQHLPTTSQFEIVEIQLDNNIISNDIFEQFKDELATRKKQRQKRARVERKREQHIFEENERQLGKSLYNSANIDLGSEQHFPTCGYEENLSLAISLPLNESTVNAGPSFAKMLTDVKFVESWPTLSSCSTQQLNQPCTSSTNLKPISRLINTANATKHDDYDSDDYSRVIDYKTSFSFAIADILETTKKNVTDSNTPNGNTNSSKKKKNKKTILFSTGMSFNSN